MIFLETFISILYSYFVSKILQLYDINIQPHEYSFMISINIYIYIYIYINIKKAFFLNSVLKYSFMISIATFEQVMVWYMVYEVT